MILSTGVLSGLGKYLYENLGGIGFTRSMPAEERGQIKRTGVDTIIHCAFNSSWEVNSDNLHRYLEDNVLLTEELVSFPHSKFIYISTVDVYPKGTGLHSEEEIIDTDTISGLYGITKLMSESIVENRCDNYLILRGSSLLGKYSRKNSLIKIIEDKGCVLALSGNSILNYVLYSSILDFIRFSIDHDLRGIYNLASSENITLSKVADMLDKKLKFGAHVYDVGNIDNSKISSVLPVFNETSREVITRFIKEKEG